MKSRRWERWVNEEMVLFGCAIFGFSFILGIVVVVATPESNLAFKKSQGFAEAKYHSKYNEAAGSAEFVRFDSLKCMSGPWNTCLPEGLQTF